MPFEMRCFGKHGTGLVAVCDVCGSIVDEPETANVCWLPNSWEMNEVYPFKIACKEECTYRLDKTEGHQFTQELGMAIFFLMNNSKVDYKHTMRKVQELDDMGLLGEPREAP